MVSEAEREKIREDAKKIMENFARSLEKISFSEKTEKESLGGFRKEAITSSDSRNPKESSGDEEFRKSVFENAPKVEGDCVVAEKKKW